MKSENKIYNFFIIAALLFWNPLSLYIIYNGTLVIDIKLVWYFYIIVFVTGIVFILLNVKNRLRRGVNNVLFSISLVGIFFGIMTSVNAILKEEAAIVEEGLVFPINRIVKSRTIEYDFEINTNSLGLRDREIEIDKGEKFRILCIGDSWTMGFGVNVEHSWPRKLQDYFIEHSIDDIEVVNGGQGGQFTTRYKEIMTKAVPLLKPDLVLVGVLQLDDLAQLYEESDIEYEAKPKT